MSFKLFFSFAAVVTCLSIPSLSEEASKSRNVIFVMTDGLRWQEVFRGADAALLNKENGGVEDVPALKQEFWRETADQRRQALLPFVWQVIAKQGQIYGNRDKNSDAYVTNGLNFSYPGYSETLCGFADPRINSNNKVPNPNETVFEWLNAKPSFKGKLAAFAAWDVFPFIFNAPRAKVLVNAGFTPLQSIKSSPQLELLNTMKKELPKYWSEEAFDVVTFHTALQYMKTEKPRVLYLSLGETDEWAHAGKYDLYLQSAHRADLYLKQLWDLAQSMPEYRDRTTLIFTPDHGRGEAPVEWKSHGEKIPASKYIWMMFMGPDTPALGERSKIPAVTQNQIASTVARLLNEDYRASVTKAGNAISNVITLK